MSQRYHFIPIYHLTVLASFPGNAYNQNKLVVNSHYDSRKEEKLILARVNQKEKRKRKQKQSKTLQRSRGQKTIPMKVINIRDFERKNHSAMREFVLLGLTQSPEIQRILFWLFTLSYVAALMGNFLLIFIICTSKKLHTPMYFLLANLSLVNALSITTTTPKLLHTLFSHRYTITFYGCIIQVYFFILFLVTELMLLTSMAFDRFVAICYPLQYTLIMRKELCAAIAVGAWVLGLTNTTVNSGLLLQLSFCESNIINHFFCDVPPVLKLSCSDTSFNETMAFVADVVFAVFSCGLTLTSYGFIIRAIFRIRSTEGKKKAFSTCSSHLIVVSFYFSGVIYTYIRPTSVYSLNRVKYISLLYSVVTPVINPIIYSLRNREVKEVLKDFIGRGRMF
ncbi:olfactory receptor 13G1-like [Thamnophis elegans]|uniref:olfactory receptor 13G1-like n=1 Tax=Thamnophis elegans TaxID=35005 RepID=UPI001379113A|nr:olfactory receptor 13G1-like [Thamnophis elegans]